MERHPIDVLGLGFDGDAAGDARGRRVAHGQLKASVGIDHPSARDGYLSCDLIVAVKRGREELRKDSAPNPGAAARMRPAWRSRRPSFVARYRPVSSASVRERHSGASSSLSNQISTWPGPIWNLQPAGRARYGKTAGSWSPRCDTWIGRKNESSDRSISAPVQRYHPEDRPSGGWRRPLTGQSADRPQTDHLVWPWDVRSSTHPSAYVQLLAARRRHAVRVRDPETSERRRDHSGASCAPSPDALRSIRGRSARRSSLWSAADRTSTRPAPATSSTHVDNGDHTPSGPAMSMPH